MMNGYNNATFDIDRQLQEERNKIAELERRKMQQMYAHPTILNQTIQTGMGQSGLRFAESIDDVKREMVFLDTLFVNKAFTNLWYKTPTGVIKTYLLEEFVPKDEKDMEIEALKNRVAQLEKERSSDANRTGDTKSVESSVSTTVQTAGANETK